MYITVFENHREGRIQDCRRSELRLHFESKGSLTMPKMANFGEFLKDLSLRSNSVTRWVTKISENCQN